MNETIDYVMGRLSTKRCDGSCEDQTPHTAHLTRFGKWRYRNKETKRKDALRTGSGAGRH